MIEARTTAFLHGFRSLRRVTQSALRAGDAEAARRSVALAEVYLDELRMLYDLLTPAMRETIWMTTSVERVV